MLPKVLLLIIAVTFFYAANSQVQVSKEPRHKPVLQNEYFRLLEVWLPPGDTTFYHIHSTPSLFLYLTSNSTSSQTLGGEWVHDSATAGKAWYRSFTPDSLIHRVVNTDSKPFHVNDIEILSAFNPGNYKPLPFAVIFDNEKAAAYSIETANGATIKDRGPIIAELVNGDGVIFKNVSSNASQSLHNGQYVYIPPGTSFSFKAPGKINLVLFEIK